MCVKMQSKINSYFKPCCSSSSADKTLDSDALCDNIFADDGECVKEPEIIVKYKRRVINPDSGNNGDLIGGGSQDSCGGNSSSKLVMAKSSKVLCKKRNYSQFHLELGQSDFLLHTCSTCGFKYATGDAEDEKVHNSFHKTYTLGIQFKVQEVVNMMEMELGEGWIHSKHCKVYLFISSKRIAGCLVAEPIEKAYRIICNTVDGTSNRNSTKRTIPGSNTLKFGSVSFQRERVKSSSLAKMSQVLDDRFSGAILCEKEAVPAMCGIRAIWVAPASRRKHIATHLLDAARQSFCLGLMLDKSQVAFSQPTSAGRALASTYSGKESFLVYMTSTDM